MKPMVRRTVVLVSPAALTHDPCVSLIIDEEGAEYIAQIMRSEFDRSNDRGALDIADGIERGMSA